MTPSQLFRFLASVLSLQLGKAKANPLMTQFSAPGDFVIGGMFSFHSQVVYSPSLKPEIPKCKNFFALGYQRHLSMRFAIAQINNSTSLLPGVTLGYEIHNTCNNVVVATKPAVSFLSKYPSDSGIKVQCNYTNYKPRVIAVVGPDTSDVSVVVARLLNFLSIPEISFASSSADLSDQDRYPSFFRTIPSDKHQAIAMVQLLSKFQWNWVAALATDDEYGRRALEIFVQMALSKDMCVAYEAILPSDPAQSTRKKELSNIAHQLQTSRINATVVFAQSTKAEELLRTVVDKEITGKVWIASECWATSPSIAHIPNLNRIGTILGMAVKSGELPGFPEYVERILASHGTDHVGSVYAEQEQCAQCKSLTMAELSATTYRSRYYASFNTYKAVYAVAHALHQLLRCNATSKTCDTNQEVYPWHVLQEIRKVNFTVDSQPVYFNESGDPPTGYDLILWDWVSPNDYEFVQVGSYDALQGQLTVNESKIYWRTEDGKVPISRCTQECKPGQKRWLRGEHNCCYQCEDCPAGYYQNKSTPNDCTPCPAHQWSLVQSTVCQDRVVEYLEVTDQLPVVMVALTSLVLAQMAAITGLVVQHRGTPATRYVGCAPTLLITLSLTCFCSSFVFFVIKPTSWVCRARQPLFFISFTVSLATLLAKAVHNSGLDRALPRPWLRENLMALSVVLNTAVQGLLCLLWYLWNPPFLEENTELERTILLQCQDISFPGYGLLLAYNLTLAVVVCICTYAGQNSKWENDMATKSISFAMILILIIWMLFVPTYATSQGKFVSLFQVFAGLASIFAIFGSYYYPVCYVLLFAPHLNTDAYFFSLPQSPRADSKPNAEETKSSG